MKDIESEIDLVFENLESPTTTQAWLLEFVTKHATSAECALCEAVREDDDPLLMAVRHPSCDWDVFKVVWDFSWVQGDRYYADVMNYAVGNPNADGRILELACGYGWSIMFSEGTFLAHDIGSKLAKIHKVDSEMVDKYYQSNDGGLPEGGCDFFTSERCPKCGW